MMGGDGIVYSTEHGRMCPGCGRPAGQCACRAEGPRPAGDGVARVQRETKGRKGKCVTVVYGLGLSGAELKDLARVLKAKCGAGGAVKEGTIEIQGDHRDAVLKELKARNLPAKRAGG